MTHDALKKRVERLMRLWCAHEKRKSRDERAALTSIASLLRFRWVSPGN